MSAEKGHHEEWSVAACGFGKRCDLASSEVLQNCVRDSGSSDVRDNLHEEATVSSLLSEVIPMFSAHADGTRFAESQHSSKCAWNELGNLGKEEVRPGGSVQRLR